MIGDITGQWVVEDMVSRLRKQWGTYAWWEYEQFAVDRGIEIHYHHRDDLPRAFHFGNIVFLQQCSSRLLLAKAAWHEFGHVVALPINAQYWDTVKWGHLVIAKTEARCSRWTSQFPDWGDDRSFF